LHVCWDRRRGRPEVFAVFSRHHDLVVVQCIAAGTRITHLIVRRALALLARRGLGLLHRRVPSAGVGLVQELVDFVVVV
jgi:hypothetical protein